MKFILRIYMVYRGNIFNGGCFLSSSRNVPLYLSRTFDDVAIDYEAMQLGKSLAYTPGKIGIIANVAIAGLFWDLEKISHQILDSY